MQTKQTVNEGLKRAYTITITADELAAKIDAEIKKVAPQVRMPGFRPGKVPMKVMQQRFGAGVRQEVLGEVMSQSFQEAVVQENLRPAGQPSIEPRNLEAGKDLEYVATFEVFPDVDVQDMAGFDVERPKAEVTEADVDNIIEVFRKQQGNWETVERAAQDGDKVNIDYAGTRDGEAFDGGTAEGSDLELGSGRMIPGFEDGIVGMSAGEEKTLSLSFPEDYHAEELKGAAVEFKVTLNSVEEMKLAELDEALFESYGVTEGGEEQFRKEVSENMGRELRNAVESRVKQQVMDAVVDAHEGVDIPQALIAQEVDAMRNQMFQQFGGAGAQDMDLKSLLPDEMFAENAERRVKLGLVLSEMIGKFDLKADADKVRETIEDLASTYEQPEEVVNWYYSNQEQLSSVESKVLEDSVVEKLLEGANITDKECSYQDALAQAQAGAQN